MQANPTQKTTIEVQNEDDYTVLSVLINDCNHRPASVDEIERVIGQGPGGQSAPAGHGWPDPPARPVRVDQPGSRHG